MTHTCGQPTGSFVASHIAGDHAARGTGDAQRSAPTGGAPNGTPKKALCVENARPLTEPSEVVTVVVDCAEAVPNRRDATSACFILCGRSCVNACSEVTGAEFHQASTFQLELQVEVEVNDTESGPQSGGRPLISESESA